MIWLAVDSAMSGTVTIGITSTGIEADTFAEAKEIFKRKIPKRVGITREAPDVIEYEVEQNDDFCTVYGSLKDEPIVLWRKHERASPQPSRPAEAAQDAGVVS